MKDKPYAQAVKISNNMILEYFHFSRSNCGISSGKSKFFVSQAESRIKSL